MSHEKQGYTNEVFKVAKVGSHFRMIDTSGTDVGTLGTPTGTRKRAFKEKQALRKYIDKNGDTQYRRVDMSEFKSKVIPLSETGDNIETPSTNEEIRTFIHEGSLSLKPDMLVIADLKWKYLIRSALRAKNIMMVGPAGCGKTLAARCLMEGLSRPGFSFNLGSTQDARATLIGNTQFDNTKGTFFAKSAFINAIQTENAVILLDELTRAHPDAWNILMPVLDQGQRYLRIDEAEGSPIVKVAKGVTFIATANIGSEYTATRVLDQAIRDRFVTIEMDLLDGDQEFKLLKRLYPNCNDDDLMALAEIADHTRQISTDEVGKLSAMISTRTSVEAAGLVHDGFSLVEAAEISIFPFFDQDGGEESERTYMKQLVQKYVRDESNTEPLFNDESSESTSQSDLPW